MAGTYYNWAERNLANEVNWSQISKGISDTLLEENKIREQKKAAIDENTRNTTKTISDVQLGENESANKFWLEGADALQKQVLMQDKLLKSGQMDFKTYSINRQNITDNVNSLADLFKNYNSTYSEGMKRMNTGLSSKQEQYQMAQLEAFTDFSNSGVYVNPTDGTVTVGKKMLDPATGLYVLDKDPSKFESINRLKNRMATKIDRFDVDKVLAAGSKMLGDEISKIRNQFHVVEFKDITKRKGYQEAEDNWIESYLGNSVNVGSILTDSVNFVPGTNLKQQYDFTRDVNNTDKGKILLVSDPENPSSGRLVPKLTTEQLGVAKEHMRERLRMMLNKETVDQRFPNTQITESDKEHGRKLQSDKETATMIGQLYWGNERDITAALNYFKNTGKFSKVERNASGVTVTNLDGTTSLMPFKDASENPLGQKNFIRAAAPLLSGTTDINEAIRSGSFNDKAPFNTETTASSTETSKNRDYISEFNQEVGGLPTGDAFKLKSQKAAPALNSLIAQYGFNAVDEGGVFGNKLKITAPNGKVLEEIKTDVNDTDALSNQEILSAFIKNNMSVGEEENRKVKNTIMRSRPQKVEKPEKPEKPKKQGEVDYKEK